ncbi:MAG: hypothetical protein HC781_06495 [Leptolyngbyaceae cyanobacterium CSU_1_4]|nr:hypothetical protein [Leptolyngbyaceae cyanobacterium CSU_1_4]
MRTTLIAVEPSNPNLAISPPKSISDWGMAIAILVFVSKELLAIWKRKDEAESKLTESLIQDLRAKEKGFVQEQGDVLKEIFLLQKKFLEEIKTLSKAAAALNTGYQISLTQMQRETAVVVVEVRQSHQQILEHLSAIETQLRALHRRLDEDQGEKSYLNQPR